MTFNISVCSKISVWISQLAMSMGSEVKIQHGLHEDTNTRAEWT